MTRLAIAFTVLAAMVGLPAAAQDVAIDYDRDYDKKPQTYGWKITGETRAENGLMHSRIKNGIEHYLAQNGLAEMDADPDIWVTYHTATDQEVSVDMAYHGYAYPRGWYWHPYGSRYYYGAGWGTTAQVSTYNIGTLVVDVWDAESDQLIWRGTVSGVVKKKPAKREKQLDKSIKKMFAVWEKMKAKEMKRRAKEGR